MTIGESERGDPAQLGLLASAIANRALAVAPGEPGAPAWTDGRVVFVDASAGARAQIEALAVQASLLAAGSLDPDLVRGLVRRPALARRYLAVEGNRALSAVETVLPPSVRPLIDAEIAARSDSPAASMSAAQSRSTIADPPASFGTIRARPLLARTAPEDRPGEAARAMSRDRENAVLDELEDDAAVDGTFADLFSNPVGGGGALGRWLGRLLAPARDRRGGAPGLEAATHRTRASTRPGRDLAGLSVHAAGAVEEGSTARRGTTYPEWDVHRRRYRPDWCTVQEIEPKPIDGPPPLAWDGGDLRRPLARLGVGLDRHRRQPQGDEIDIDAAVEARVEVMAGAVPDETFYVDSLRRRRDLSVLLLLDVSGSAAEPSSNGGTVHEEQRAAAGALAVALHDLGDRVALYAFHSRGRSAVHLAPVKRFDDAVDTLVLRRLLGLVPGGYSRLGAAIRHGGTVLEERGGTSQRLLVVLSDGLAYDHGYEPEYGAADARRALAEARRRGTACLCLSVGACTDADSLRRVFGSASYARVARTDQLSRVIGPSFRAALRSAAAGRRDRPARTTKRSR